MTGWMHFVLLPLWACICMNGACWCMCVCMCTARDGGRLMHQAVWRTDSCLWSWVSGRALSRWDGCKEQVPEHCKDEAVPSHAAAPAANPQVQEDHSTDPLCSPFFWPLPLLMPWDPDGFLLTGETSLTVQMSFLLLEQHRAARAAPSTWFLKYCSVIKAPSCLWCSVAGRCIHHSSLLLPVPPSTHVSTIPETCRTQILLLKKTKPHVLSHTAGGGGGKKRVFKIELIFFKTSFLFVLEGSLLVSSVWSLQMKSLAGTPCQLFFLGLNTMFQMKRLF